MGVLQGQYLIWWMGCVLTVCVLPLAPFAPVLRREMQTFGVNAEMAFLHGPLVTFHYFLGQGKDILTLQGKWAKLINMNSRTSCDAWDE